MKETDLNFNRDYINLASERLGAKTLACSDDFFAEVENLLKPGRGIFIDDKYTDRGKWMDGWESRRSFGRNNGREHDWAIIQLAYTGKLIGVDVDTHHFKGNSPLQVSIEGAYVENIEEAGLDGVEWFSLLTTADVLSDSQNLFKFESQQPCNLLRLNIYPDGGVARLKVYGEVIAQVQSGKLVDLANLANGGRAISCSDMFFSDMNNILLPDESINMGDGWETKRRRDNGYDWNIVKLGVPGSIEKVMLETKHFKGNFPDRFSLEAANTDELDDNVEWQEIIKQTPLQADKEHVFEHDALQIGNDEVFTHVRLNIFPDGGVSRLRVFGKRQK